MRKKTLTTIIGLSMLATITLTGAFCTYASAEEVQGTAKYKSYFSGNGTASDPFLLTSEHDYEILSTLVERGENFQFVSFYQTQNIDFTRYFKPIGNADKGTGFAGTIDGGGHTIRNLRIDERYSTVSNALFGAFGGTLLNLGVEGGKIEGDCCATFVASGMPGMLPVIYNCYSAEVEFAGFSRNGAIVDNYNGSIDRCWAITANENPLVGYGASSVTNCISNSEMDETNIAFAENNIVIPNEAFLTEALVDYLNETCVESSMLRASTVLGYRIGEGHPVFTNDFYTLEGVGTRGEPYLIQSAEDLAFFSASVNGGKDYKGEYVQMTGDIDLSVYENFVAIGTYDSGAYFNGTFDGNGYAIQNMTMLKTAEGRIDNNALFGTLGGYVVNLTIENGEIHGACCATFAVGGDAESRIVNCLARNNTLYGVDRNGGFVDNYAGKLASCYLAGNDAFSDLNVTTVAYSVSEGRIADGNIAVNVGNKVGFTGNIDSVMNERLLYGALRISFDPTLLKFWEGGRPCLNTYGLMGEGTKENPYLISKPSDLVFFSACVNSGNDFEGQIFHQVSDLDMKGVFFMPIGVTNGLARFMGEYDGCGHTISNLVIRDNELSHDNALFGSLEGTVVNVGVESGSIYGLRAAGLVCESYRSVIRNSYSKANVYGFVRSGGLVDDFDGMVVLCYYQNEQNHPLVSYDCDKMYACVASGDLVSPWMNDSFAVDCISNYDFNVDEEFVQKLNEKLLVGATKYAYQRSSLNLWGEGLKHTDEKYSFSPEMISRFSSVMVACYKWNVLGVLALLGATVFIVLSFIFEGKKRKK